MDDLVDYTDRKLDLAISLQGFRQSADLVDLSRSVYEALAQFYYSHSGIFGVQPSNTMELSAALREDEPMRAIMPLLRIKLGEGVATGYASRLRELATVNIAGKSIDSLRESALNPTAEQNGKLVFNTFDLYLLGVKLGYEGNIAGIEQTRSQIMSMLKPRENPLAVPR